MKRFFKIFGIIVGVLLLLVLIVAGILIHSIFTPSRLTPVVDGMMGKYISCDHHIGEVELTVFSTFPEIGVRVKDVTLINATAGAPSDTVAHIGSAIGIVNIQQYLDNKDLEINKLLLDDVCATLYTDSCGNNNYMVFKSDSASTDTASAWPFGTINLHELSLGTTSVRYTDLGSGIDATLLSTDVDIQGEMSGDSVINGTLSLDCGSATVMYHNKNFLHSQALNVSMPTFRLNLDSMSVNVSQTEVNVGDFLLSLDGRAAIPNDTVLIDMDVHTINTWAVDSLLALVNRNIPNLNLDYDIHGNAVVSAHVIGEYYTKHYPKIIAHAVLTDGSGSYEGVPYKLEEVNADADIRLDLNDSTKTSVTIRSASARTRQSAVKVKGNIDQLLADMRLDLDIDADINIPDLKDYLADNINITGRAKGPVKIRTRLSDLTGMRFDHVVGSAQLNVSGLDLKYDDIAAQAQTADIALKLPSGNAKAPFAHMSLKTPNINAKKQGGFSGNITNADISADINDITKKNAKNLIADIVYDFGHLTADVDDMHADLNSPRGKGTVDYNMSGSNAVPGINATLKSEAVAFSKDTIQAQLKSPDIALNLKGQSGKRDQVQASVKYSGGHIFAKMGTQIAAEVANLAFSGSVKQDDKQFDFLNIWNPDLKVKLGDGYADFDLLPYRLEIPSIDFDFTPDNAVIRNSRVRLGNSDFALDGNVTNLNRWLSGEANLGGDLNFTSNYTDVNQLMDLTSGFGDNDSTATEPIDDDGDPFMVPKGVDLVLHTRIHKAAIGRQIANELGGNLYINDGTLVLEEMGFICQAARLQLTALYRTPRRNHIYTGVDLHMLDIHIHELIDMIPDAQEMLPMLSSFSGKAEFHLALETFMNAKYELKTSTSIGAASLEGKDLVLLDSETFTKIAKLLLFRKKTENIVDSISAEITLWNRQVDIYPFMMSIDKYAAAVGGQHNLNGTYDYHISLVKPLPIGVNVKTGDDKKLHIKPTTPKYKSNFEPVKRNGVEAQNLKLREQIRAALKKNVK